MLCKEIGKFFIYLVTRKKANQYRLLVSIKVISTCRRTYKISNIKIDNLNYLQSKFMTGSKHQRTKYVYSDTALPTIFR